MKKLKERAAIILILLSLAFLIFSCCRPCVPQVLIPEKPDTTISVDSVIKLNYLLAKIKGDLIKLAAKQGETIDTTTAQGNEVSIDFSNDQALVTVNIPEKNISVPCPEKRIKETRTITKPYVYIKNVIIHVGKFYVWFFYCTLALFIIYLLLVISGLKTKLIKMLYPKK